MVIPDADFLTDAAAELYALRDAARVAEGIARIARDAVSCSDAVVSFVAAHGRLSEAAGTSDEASRAVQLQNSLGGGPGIAAIEGHSVVTCDELAGEGRWPTWARAAAAAGFRSTLAVPLHERGRAFALLQLCDVRPGVFDTERVSVATLLARRSSLVLAAVNRAEQLESAMDARTVIGQAQGILMERYDLDADRAFSVLRRYSQHANTKLRVIAEQVVRERSLPDVDCEAS